MGATELFDWEDAGRRLRFREFVGAEWRIPGFVVSVEGVQYDDGSVVRFVAVDVHRDDAEATVCRRGHSCRLADAVRAAADEIAKQR